VYEQKERGPAEFNSMSKCLQKHFLQYLSIMLFFRIIWQIKRWDWRSSERSIKYLLSSVTLPIFQW